MRIKTRFDLEEEVIIRKERIKGIIEGVRIRGKGRALVIMYEVAFVEEKEGWMGIRSRYCSEAELISIKRILEYPIEKDRCKTRD